ncbi:hypothetical protein [Streptacidiphilus sp. EB129]|uniref:hypothetical protein n=1 Tax=Streptacidiphilus sp. EB129 TaxID=3156262 RepID=UPI00351148BD
MYAVTKAAEGQPSLHDVGPVTLSLEELTRAELTREWEWLIDGCLPGDRHSLWRLTARGIRVHHPIAGLLGTMIQTAITPIHVEWYHPAMDDHLYVGQAQRLRHGAAYIIDARRHHGYPVPADPPPAATPAFEPPVRLGPGEVARYCGSLAELRGQLVRVKHCDCDEDFCAGYRAEPLEPGRDGAVHVRRTSFDAVAEGAQESVDLHR